MCSHTMRITIIGLPYSKVHGANMGPIWGRQGSGEPHVGPMNFAIWVVSNDSFRKLKLVSDICNALQNVRNYACVLPDM